MLRETPAAPGWPRKEGTLQARQAGLLSSEPGLSLVRIKHFVPELSAITCGSSWGGEGESGTRAGRNAVSRGGVLTLLQPSQYRLNPRKPSTSCRMVQEGLGQGKKELVDSEFMLLPIPGQDNNSFL